LVASLSLTPGCAKLHNKLHKHKHGGEEFAYAQFPAKSSHAGLASVSPQMPTMVHSTVSKQEPVAYSSSQEVVEQPQFVIPQSPARSELRASPFAHDSSKAGGSAKESEKPAAPAVPAPVNITPKPAASTPSISPKSDLPSSLPPADAKTPAPELPKAAEPPASKPDTPALDPKLPVTPPQLPPSDSLPIELPKDLPPPPAAANPDTARSVAAPSAVIATTNPSLPSLSPFSPSVANSNDDDDRVITLTQPGDVIAPAPIEIPAPAETKPAAPANPKVVGTEAKSAVDELAAILNKTQQTFSTVTNYRVNVLLQERMNGRLLPEDKFTLSKRREPLAVRMEWTDGKEVGREVIFSPTQTDGLIKIRLPKGLLSQISMAPDSPLVRSKSRHPINEAGADSVVERLFATLNRFKANDPNAGQLSVEHVVDSKLGKIQRVTHHNAEREIWVVDLDETNGLPLTIHATDEAGELLEHYEFRGYELNLPELLTAEAFDHTARWGDKSLFGRLATGLSKDADTKR
jgi:hypothetical protein